MSMLKKGSPVDSENWTSSFAILKMLQSRSKLRLLTFSNKVPYGLSIGTEIFDLEWGY